LYFLNISEGSLAEVGHCLHAACRLGYISTETLAELNAELNGVGAPLAGLVRSTRLMPSLVSILMFGLLLGVVIGRYVW
jgi:hypothetical protein